MSEHTHALGEPAVGGQEAGIRLLPTRRGRLKVQGLEHVQGGEALLGGSSRDCCGGGGTSLLGGKQANDPSSKCGTKPRAPGLTLIYTYHTSELFLKWKNLVLLNSILGHYESTYNVPAGMGNTKTSEIGNCHEELMSHGLLFTSSPSWEP